MNRIVCSLLLLATACTPLQGAWEGEVNCDGEELEVVIDLEWDGDAYVGEGALNCTAYWGAPCVQKFEVNVDPDQGPFAGELDVDIDDCRAETEDGEVNLGCSSPDDVEWDGGDSIEGDWSECEFELERE